MPVCRERDSQGETLALQEFEEEKILIRSFRGRMVQCPGFINEKVQTHSKSLWKECFGRHDLI